MKRKDMQQQNERRKGEKKEKVEECSIKNKNDQKSKVALHRYTSNSGIESHCITFTGV